MLETFIYMLVLGIALTAIRPEELGFAIIYADKQM